MFHLSTHTAALTCAILLLNISFSSGKKKPSDIPSEAEWGSIESIEVDGLERIIAEAEAKAKAKKEMGSHGAIQAGLGPVVHNENIGGGANETIDGQGEGGAGKEDRIMVAGHRPVEGKSEDTAAGNETTEGQRDAPAGQGANGGEGVEVKAGQEGEGHGLTIGEEGLDTASAGNETTEGEGSVTGRPGELGGEKGADANGDAAQLDGVGKDHDRDGKSNKDDRKTKRKHHTKNKKKKKRKGGHKRSRNDNNAIKSKGENPSVADS